MIEHYFDCPHCWENQLKMIDSSIEITNECLNLISSMIMGSNEYSEFLKTQK